MAGVGAFTLWPMVAPQTTATHRPYCSMQCGIKLVAGDGPPGLEPWLDFPTNRGRLCQKGWTAAELLGHPDRLTEPLLRDRPDGPLRPAPWGAGPAPGAGGM